MYKIKLSARSSDTENGSIQIRVIFWIAFVCVAAYGAYLVVPPFVSYKMLQYEVEGEAKIAHMYTNAEIKNRIIEKAAGWSVDLDQDEVEIIRDYAEIQIAVSYGISVVFFGNIERTFFYDIYANEPLKSRMTDSL